MSQHMKKDKDQEFEMDVEPAGELKREVRRNLVVGLDIGTTKICCVVGEVFQDAVDIIGVGTTPSLGMRKGVVVNIESTVASIRKSVKVAEDIAGCDLESVYVGIAGNHIKGFNSPGILAINNREIKQADVQEVITAASKASRTAIRTRKPAFIPAHPLRPAPEPRAHRQRQGFPPPRLRSPRSRLPARRAGPATQCCVTA